MPPANSALLTPKGGSQRLRRERSLAEGSSQDGRGQDLNQGGTGHQEMRPQGGHTGARPPLSACRQLWEPEAASSGREALGTGGGLLRSQGDDPG